MTNGVKIEHDISPAALVAGSPAEADRYLCVHLWGNTKPGIHPERVLNWANTLSEAMPRDAVNDARNRYRARNA